MTDDSLNEYHQQQLNRERVARHAERQREQGRVQRKIWANPDDWPKIKALVDKLNKARENPQSEEK